MKLTHDKISPFSEGLAVVHKNGEWFHVNPDGIPAYKERYEWAGPFSQGVALVRKNSRWFCIHPDGKRVKKFYLILVS